jgi:hypothetical protein
MDQLLEFSSDEHAIHTKLFRHDAPSVITSRAASSFHWNCHRQVLRPNPVENLSPVALSGFEAQLPNRCEYRTVDVSLMS